MFILDANITFNTQIDNAITLKLVSQRMSYANNFWFKNNSSFSDYASVMQRMLQYHVSFDFDISENIDLRPKVDFYHPSDKSICLTTLKLE